MRRDRAAETDEADADREELEHDEGEPGDEQEVGAPTAG
jgi:hypothetical protein